MIAFPPKADLAPHMIIKETFMAKILVIVPFALSEKGLANRRVQLDSVWRSRPLWHTFGGT